MNKMIVILTLSMSLVLAGCQSTNGNTKDVDPALTKGNAGNFFSKSAWQSCAVGAGITGVGCLLLKGNAATCIASAAVGCGVMMGANHYLEAKRSEYIDKEQRLDAYIYDIQQNTLEIQAVTEAAKGVLNKNLATLNALNRQIQNESISRNQAKNELNKIDANIAYLNEKLGRMKKVESDWVSLSSKEKIAGLNVAKLNKQINQLHKQILSLEKQINIVSKQRSVVQVS